jgi:Pentapeptide repeats (8 copies)
MDPKGEKKIEVRLGGIYALERVARDSQRDHGVIMEILTNYVRVHSPRTYQGDAKTTKAISENERLPVGVDIQSILTVLGRRNTNFDIERLDLSEASLRGANLTGANLSGANLLGADLSGTNLFGAELHWANLFGANLRGANLSIANFSYAILFGADLIEAQGLTQSQIDSAFGDANTKLPPDLVRPKTWRK